MRTILYSLLLFLSAFTMIACGPRGVEMDETAVREIVKETLAEQQAAQRNGVFVHITAGPKDPHRVLMPLQMAVMMSDSQDVLVYFDIDAVEVVLKGADDLTYKQFSSSQTQLGKLLEKGVPVYVCPGCLEAAGYTPEDVMEGVRIAEKEAFFTFTEGRVLTLDY